MISGLTISGSNLLQGYLTRLGEDAPQHMGDALYRQAEYIMTKSKQQCPVDTGNLRASGHVGFPVVSGQSALVQLGYGGTAGDVVSVSTKEGSTEVLPTGEIIERKAYTKVKSLTQDVGYALIVHENPNAHHPVGKWKYLEDPMLEAASSLESKLAADLRRTWKDLQKGTP